MFFTHTMFTLKSFYKKFYGNSLVYKKDNLRAAYGKVRQLKDDYKLRTALCKYADGSILGGIDNIKTRWAQYFIELLKDSQTVSLISSSSNENSVKIQRSRK